MSKNAMVSYHNRFNSVFFEPLSATQQNCLYALFHKLKDKGGDTIVISKKELVLLTGFEKGGNRDFKEYILNTIGALQNLKLRNTIDDKIITQFIIFPKLAYNTETETMSVKVAKDFQPYLNNLSGDFTHFSIEEFVGIKGKYAKTLYRRLKQYNSVGVAIIDFDQLIRQMGIPESYTTSKIDASILKPALKELSGCQSKDGLLVSEKPFQDLICEKIRKSGRGRKIDKLKFTWKPITNGLSEAFKNLSDFKKWLFKSVDGGDFLTNIFNVDGAIVSIARFERKEDGNYQGIKIILDNNLFTDKDEAEKVLDKVYQSLIGGEIKKYIIQENITNNHSILFLQEISRKMSDQEKLKWVSEETRELFQHLLELKGKRLTLPPNVTANYFEEDEELLIQDVYVQYLSKEIWMTFYSERRRIEKGTPIKDPSSVEFLKKQIEKFETKETIVEGFLL